MKIFNNRLLIRNIDAGEYLEIFFASAVTTVIVVRLFLFLTGYPQIGGGGLHIAHMLWGGLLLMVSLFLNLIYLNKSMHYISSLIGGVGFGLFIDELGKFITQDNDYFFQPTIALMYIIFVLIFIFIRYIANLQTYNPREYLMNALLNFEEVVFNDLNSSEKNKLDLLLQKSDQKFFLTQKLQSMLDQLTVLPDSKISIIKRLGRKGYSLYSMFRSSSKIQKIVLGLIILHSVSILTSSLLSMILLAKPNLGINIHLGTSLESLIDVSVSIICSVIVIVGVYWFKKSKYKGLTLIKMSLLISLFVSQVFSFYENQLVAIFELAQTVFAFTVVQFMIFEEKSFGLLRSGEFESK